VTISDTLVLRPASSDEFDALYALVRMAFHSTGPPDDRDAEFSVFEPERSLAFFDGDAAVGSASAYTRDITLPGGPAPVACVTWVSVAPTHTRRGLLTRMMRHQLTELHEQNREPVAALWASESGIYGRYGYGLASQRSRISAGTRDIRLLHPVPAAERAIRLGEATDKELRADIAAVYERVRTSTIGHCDRRDKWWEHRLQDPEHDREGATALRIAVHDGPAGPDGYVIYAIKPGWTDQGPDGEATVHELEVENPEAHAAIWSFLLSIDLVTKLQWRIAPADTPFAHMVDQPGRLKIDLGDNLWVRLVDVDRALAIRRYATPVDVTFEVADAFCPWNEGRWRLTGGPDSATCVRTDDEADLALSSTDLGAAYLGGTRLAALAAAGRITELLSGALRAASVAFAEPRQPYCPEVF
jgi:predicted acetyltransferase